MAHVNDSLVEVLPLGFEVQVESRLSLAQLRQAVSDTHAAAVAELNWASGVTGHDYAVEQLMKNFMNAQDVQRGLLRQLREWWAREESDDVSLSEGPLDDGERVAMQAVQKANDRLNALRLAIAALRARELSELSEAGAVVALRGKD